MFPNWPVKTFLKKIIFKIMDSKDQLILQLLNQVAQLEAQFVTVQPTPAAEVEEEEEEDEEEEEEEVARNFVPIPPKPPGTTGLTKSQRKNRQKTKRVEKISSRAEEGVGA